MKDTETVELGTPTIWLRVLGAIILVTGFWMLLNPDPLLEIVFDSFGGQSIGPLIILVLPPILALPILPIYFGTHYLFFPKKRFFFQKKR
jgi:hypothetical protein